MSIHWAPVVDAGVCAQAEAAIATPPQPYWECQSLALSSQGSPSTGIALSWRQSPPRASRHPVTGRWRRMRASSPCLEAGHLNARAPHGIGCLVTPSKFSSSLLPHSSRFPVGHPWHFLHTDLHLGIRLVGSHIGASIQGQLDSSSVLFHWCTRSQQKRKKRTDICGISSGFQVLLY